MADFFARWDAAVAVAADCAARLADACAEFAAFRSALRPSLAPLRVDDRPAVVLRPTGPDPSRR